jgi:hypothetical protein
MMAAVKWQELHGGDKGRGVIGDAGVNEKANDQDKPGASGKCIAKPKKKREIKRWGMVLEHMPRV